MELKDTPLYEYVKDYEDQIKIVKFKKGEYIEKAACFSEHIYYILEGTVKMESVTRSGNKILVDQIGPNEFAGHISKIRKSRFNCDAFSKTATTLVRIPDYLVHTLLENHDFATLFYNKTSDRLYYMYKKFLLERLYTWEEIVAYYILENSSNGVFIYKSMYDICEQLNISRRGLYNITNKLVYEEALEKKDNIFIIKDEIYLKELASGIIEFYRTYD